MLAAAAQPDARRCVVAYGRSSGTARSIMELQEHGSMIERNNLAWRNISPRAAIPLSRRVQAPLGRLRVHCASARNIGRSTANCWQDEISNCGQRPSLHSSEIPLYFRCLRCLETSSCLGIIGKYGAQIEFLVCHPVAAPATVGESRRSTQPLCITHGKADRKILASPETGLRLVFRLLRRAVRRFRMGKPVFSSVFLRFASLDASDGFFGRSRRQITIF